MASFDIRLIPEFSGDKKDESIAEWFSKVTWLCKLNKVKDVELVLPLRLTGHAYKIYDQLSEDERLNVAKVKSALFKAFEADVFSAYEQLHDRRLEQAEPVDAYLADIRRLAGLAGGMTEKAMCSAFVFGLPDFVRRTLRTNSRMTEMNMTELSECARAIMADQPSYSAKARELPVPSPQTDFVARRSSPLSGRRQHSPVCFSCGLPGHFQRGCPQRRNGSNRQIPKYRTQQDAATNKPNSSGATVRKEDNNRSENCRWE